MMAERVPVTLSRIARKNLRKRNAIARDAMAYIQRNYRVLAQCARNHGYALAVHGSLLRDVDLIAAPWIPQAKAPSTLAKAILGIVKALSGRDQVYVRMNEKPTAKPHGRVAWGIFFSANVYLDLSVMPREKRK